MHNNAAASEDFVASTAARSRASLNPILHRQIGAYPMLDAAGERSCAERIAAARLAAWETVLTAPRKAVCSLFPTGAARHTAADLAAADTAVGTRLDRCLAAIGRSVEGAAKASAPAPWAVAIRTAIARLDAASHAFERSNFRLVVSIARDYLHHSTALAFCLDDLFAWGCIGLRIAARRFDPERGLKFSTMADWWIRHEIRRALADHGRAIRLPVHVQNTANAIRRARAELGADATPKQVAEALGVSVEKVNLTEESTRIAGQVDSLDAPVRLGNDSDKRTIGETLGALMVDPAGQEEPVLNRAMVDRLLAGLRPRDRAVIAARYGVGERAGACEAKLDEIAREHGFSRQWAQRVEMIALDKMRAAAEGRPRRPRPRSAQVRGQAVQMALATM